MARLAACKVSIVSANDALDECLRTFLAPETDPKGKLRMDLMDALLEALGWASRAAEAADETLADLDRSAWQAREPWDVP